MLKQRILTAVILIPLVVAALFYLSIPWLATLLGIFIAAAAWEWAGLSGLRGPAPKLAYVAGLLLFGVAAINGMLRQPQVILSLLAAAGLWWLWALGELILRRGDISRGMFSTMAGRMVGGLLTLVPAWTASVYLLAADAERPGLLLFVLVLVWVADTAAYFAGHRFGKTRLAPHISPGKTVEGVIGGVLAVVLLAWLCGTMFWKFEARLLAGWVGLAVLAGLFSVIGDLTESKLKRIAKVKDSGALLPGHGGILDRIDALTAAVPVFALGATVLLKH